MGEPKPNGVEIGQNSPLFAFLLQRKTDLQLSFPDSYERNFEYRVCSQFLKLPQTMALLEDGGENSIFHQMQRQQRGGMRRLLPKPSPLDFYKSLIIEGYNHLDGDGRLTIRKTLIDEITSVLEQQSRNIEQEPMSAKQTVIVGAGGTGLTVARELLSKGMKPEDVLVVERRSYLGGQMAEKDMLPFDLLKNGNMKGGNLLVGYKDLARMHFGNIRSTHYKNAVAINAFFAGVQVLLGHEVVSHENNTIEVSSDGTNKLYIRGANESSTKEIRANAVVLAMGQQSVYGTMSPNEVRGLPEESQNHVYTAGEFLKSLTDMAYMGREERREALKILLQGRIALIGVLDSAHQITENIARILDGLGSKDLGKLFGELSPSAAEPLITIFGGYNSYQSLRDKFLFIVNEYGCDLELESIIGYRHERVNWLIGKKDIIIINRQKYGAVVFTGYKQIELDKTIRGISVDGIKILGGYTLEEERLHAIFSERGKLPGTRVFYTGQPFMGHVREPLISDDGKNAVHVAGMVWKSLA